MVSLYMPETKDLRRISPSEVSFLLRTLIANTLKADSYAVSKYLSIS